MHVCMFMGEGNGNPLQCSCLENPENRGAWWAAVYGVVQSQTRLKRLSSSSLRVYTLQCTQIHLGKHYFFRVFLDQCWGQGEFFIFLLLLLQIFKPL